MNEERKIEKDLFEMVYQWGRVGVVTDELSNAFQAKAKELTDKAVLAERARIERGIDKDFIVFVRPQADVVDWLAQDHNGDYHRLQEVRGKEVLQPNPQDDFYGQSVEDLDRPRVEKENKELNQALDSASVPALQPKPKRI